MKREILIVGLFLLVVCVSIGAVNAVYLVSSSESTNSEGDSIIFDNGTLVIQGIEFAIPDGYLEVNNEKILGKDSKSFKGFKESLEKFVKGKEQIIVKVSYSNNTSEVEYTPVNTSVEKTISNQTGWLIEDNFASVFTYVKDEKIVQIIAPNETTIAYIIK